MGSKARVNKPKRFLRLAKSSSESQEEEEEEKVR